ncbi:peptidoglycan DD-metalloendopeptidase family protein [uncultured Cohaesibacter sp.]|uniref:murein hydrolase activator EnvC family protein n=1 Tax=uncultured Cohaesibacter sp. TaxID=1002546 RepID=UPI0029C8C4D3|nr:peptidoglycan DD-metalloendopeptidase family protein [uncultured Cohaesibacter sp.]
MRKRTASRSGFRAKPTRRATHALALAFLAALTLLAEPVWSTESATATSDEQSQTQDQSAGQDGDKQKTEEEQQAERALEARLKARKDQEDALAQLESSIALSKQKQEELSAEIAQIKSDRETIRSDMIATGERISNLEGSISQREDRLKLLFSDQTELKVSLAEQRDSLSEILAALQRIGRNPPPALVIRPNEALSAVRSAILLSTLVPEIRVEANALASQLAQLIQLQKEIEDEKSALQTSLASLQEEGQRLDLLIEKKKAQEATTQQAAEEEQQKTNELAAKARTLEQLINGMEQEIEAARIAVKEAQDAEKRALQQEIETKKQKIAALKDAARLSPAIPFVKMKGLMHLPANGAILKAYGNEDGFGGQTQGISVATRIGAQVTSPSDGWIVYAGPFRSFGKLLIINAGGGYHIVLSGMDEVYPEVGSFVLANEPVGKMQQTRLASSDLLDANASRPVLYIELRKDGVAIDPSPWWTADLKEKADG